MFIPGETVAHAFIIPFALEEIDHVIVSYKQNDDIILEKMVDSDFETKGEKSTYFSFILTQTESLLFPNNAQYSVQCNVYTKSGSRHASKPLKNKTGTQYLEEVMNSG